MYWKEVTKALRKVLNFQKNTDQKDVKNINKMPKKIIYKGKKYLISKSDRKNKQKKVKLPSGKIVHFGDPDMKEYPGTKRGNNYCARSYGIGKEYGILGDVKSPNFWSRKYLWNCNKKKSLKSRKKALKGGK